MISKTKLLPLLIEHGYIDNSNHVGFEAFGRKVFAYVRVKDMATRQRLEDMLTGLGHRVSKKYWPGSPTVEVQVSYFKAWHHDE